MFHRLTQFLNATLHEGRPARAHRLGLAGTLLERADACAGRDPQRAAELRWAALAYLGVVR